MPVTENKKALAEETVNSLETAKKLIESNYEQINYQNPKVSIKLADRLLDIFSDLPSGLF